MDTTRNPAAANDQLSPMKYGGCHEISWRCDRDYDRVILGAVVVLTLTGPGKILYEL